MAAGSGVLSFRAVGAHVNVPPLNYAHTTCTLSSLQENAAVMPLVPWAQHPCSTVDFTV